MNPQGIESAAPTHVQEAMKLESDGYVHLFYIRMTPPGEPQVVYTLTPQKTVNWQGFEWEGFAVHLTEYKESADGELARPKLSLANPEGIFSTHIHARWMDGAEVVRYRVLKQHLDANVNSYLKNTWRVRRVMTLNKSLAVFELSQAIDGPAYLLPARAFYPPEFSSVSV